jgi:cytochrome c-type biogenesis protein CcmH/NrfG
MTGLIARRRGAAGAGLTLLAIVVIACLAFGTIVAIITERGDNGDIAGDDAAVRITPGAEVARLETVVANDPNDVDSMIVLAEVLANSGQVARSIPWYERAVAARPNDIAYRLAFGRALQRSGNQFDAELQLTRAFDLDNTSVEAAFYLGLLYEQWQPPRIDDARRWYQRSIDVDPDSVYARQARDQLAGIDASSASPVATP